jgi:hypothetical protein
MDAGLKLRPIIKQLEKMPNCAASTAVSANGTALANQRADRSVLSRIETGSDMRLDEINGASSRQIGGPARGAAAQAAGHASASRALVALSPAAVGHEVSANHRQAAFLAHLIATKDQLPQTRERRRAEPDQVIAAYRAVEAMTKHYQ